MEAEYFINAKKKFIETYASGTECPEGLIERETWWRKAAEKAMSDAKRVIDQVERVPFLTLEQFLGLDPTYTKDMYIVRKANWELYLQNEALFKKQKSIYESHRQDFHRLKAAAEYAYAKDIADAKALADKKALAEEKVLADTKALAEAKALADAEGIADTKAIAYAKGIADAKAAAYAKGMADAKALAYLNDIANAKELAAAKAAAYAKGIADANEIASAKALANEKILAYAKMIKEVFIVRAKTEEVNRREVTEAFQLNVIRRKRLWSGSLLAGLLLFVIINVAGKFNSAISEEFKFSNFPSAVVYDGASVKLVLDNPLAKKYKTRIGAALSASPVFAGEYNRADWMCGKSCFITVFVNKRTGKVINQTFGGEFGPYLVEFKLDSGLIKAEGYVLDKNGNVTDEYAAYFYQLEDEQLKLIKTSVIAKPADANHDGEPD